MKLTVRTVLLLVAVFLFVLLALPLKGISFPFLAVGLACFAASFLVR